jgi:pimeloyl-ACP methyl ester carboxylesterase
MDEARYREAERALWASEGLEPTEHWIELASTGTRARVQAVGEGEPVLFVHGGPNAGSTWVPLAPHVPGRRLLFLDRPGAGLSDPVDLDVDTLGAVADRLVADVLDGLAIDHADVVASSFGSWCTLRSAVAAPDRIGRMAHLGCPAFVPGFRMIGMLRVLSSPLRHVIFRLPPSERAADMSLRAIGHGASLAAGRLPASLAPWYAALQAHTDTYVNEADLIARLAGPVRGFDRRLALDEATLSSVAAPCLLVWGADDTFGGEEVGAALRDALPDAELVVLPDSGHLPWFDDLGHVGALVTRHLAAGPSAAPAPTVVPVP